MHITRSLEQIKSVNQAVVVAIGVFDGVHLGHQHVIRLCREQAQRENASAWVMTFDPHPLRVVQPSAAPRLLTTLSARLELLSGQQVDGCMVIPFTSAFSELEPEAFLNELVRRIPDLRGIVIGENWRFGREARGNVALLHSLAQSFKFHVAVAKPVLWQGRTISSTRIRESIAAGALEDAASMLGRPHAIRGPVIHGTKRGRRLGFPTANLDVRGSALPPSGIYAARVHHENAVFPGAVYLPAHPEPQHGTLEVHLIDYSGDLYGKELHVEFLAKIRDDDRRFSDENDLIKQIRSDVARVREALA